MINWTKLPLSNLLEAYAVANTATFLYQRFRADSTVQVLAARHTVDELVASLAEFTVSQDRTVEAVVKAYACLVALSYKDAAANTLRSAGVNLARLKWGMQIVALMQGYSATHRFSYVPYRPSIVQPNMAEKDASTNVSHIKAVH